MQAADIPRNFYILTPCEPAQLSSRAAQFNFRERAVAEVNLAAAAPIPLLPSG